MSYGILEEVAETPKIIEWTITDFFELPKVGDLTIYSSEFNFLHYTCKLSALPYGTRTLPEAMVVDLHGIGKDGIIRWELQVRRSNDTLFKRCRGLKEEGEEMVINIYLPLPELRNGILADGFLKVRCTLCCDDAIYEEELHDENNKITQTAALIGYDKLSYDLEEMMLNGDYSDATIRVGGKEFKVHKSVLSLRAAYFVDMHKDRMAENETVIELEDCDGTAFQEFLRYLYTGRIANYCPHVLFKLANLCEKYRMFELMTFCIETVIEFLDVDIFCRVVKLAVQSKKEKLVGLCAIFLSENMAEIKEREEWHKFEIEHPDAAAKLVDRALFILEQKNSTWKYNFLQKFFKKNKRNMRR